MNLYQEHMYLMHYGIKRRSGRYKYGTGDRPYQHTVFISGSSKTQSKDSEYYRRKLPKDVRKKIDEYINSGDKIIVGDATGIDRQVQEYLNKKHYKDVEVYGPGKKVRYTANKKWKTNPIDAPEFEEGSAEWLRKKDEAMTNAADSGLAVILDEGAKATRNNVERLMNQNKSVEVYEINKGGKRKDKWTELERPKKEESQQSNNFNKNIEQISKEAKKYKIPGIKDNPKMGFVEFMDTNYDKIVNNKNFKEYCKEYGGTDYDKVYDPELKELLVMEYVGLVYDK